MIDDEPSMNSIDDFHKPMPPQKKALLQRIVLIISGGILGYFIVSILSGQMT